jgi:hypothetical protein
MKTWLVGLTCAIVALVVLLAILAFSGFADIPCQDGRWDETRRSCVPT